MRYLSLFLLLTITSVQSAELYTKTLLNRINKKVRAGALQDLTLAKIQELDRHLEKALSVINGQTTRPQGVMCAPEDSTDFAIFRIADGKQIGYDKYGNAWCAKSMASAKAGVVCAPEDSTDFAYYRVSDGRQIGYDKYGNSHCAASRVSRKAGVVCAPEDSTDFAIYRISDGKQIGYDKHDKTGSWCDAVIRSAGHGVICAPEDSTDFALYRVSDGKKISADRRGYEWCIQMIEGMKNKKIEMKK